MEKMKIKQDEALFFIFNIYLQYALLLNIYNKKIKSPHRLFIAFYT